MTVGYYYYATLGWILLIVLHTAFLAFRTRSAPAAFNEAIHIAGTHMRACLPSCCVPVCMFVVYIFIKKK